MALQLRVATDFGIDSIYHKITEIIDDLTQRTAVVTVSSWTSLESRLAYPNKPIRIYVYRFGNTLQSPSEPRDLSYPISNQQITNDTSAIYVRIKTFPEWTGAVDL